VATDPIEVEVNIKIPKLTIKSLDHDDKVIDNSTVRFAKLVKIPVIPKPGALLQLTTSGDKAFECRVTRADWNDSRSLFIVSCSYSSRSIPQEVYAALINDSDWQMKQLL